MGGYAPVIRATDHPVPPGGAGRTGRTARQGEPDRPDDDVYVYRDPGARAGYLADQRAQEREAAYWYDMTLDPGNLDEETARGPFEPLLPSSGPPPDAARHQPSRPDATMAAPPGTDDDPPARPGAASEDGQEEPAHAQARRLEQIKDLYLTAEAIGEENVGKHFDQLLAQQRALISDYFRQSAAARRADALPAQADANPIEPRPPGGPEGAGVAAEPPRAW
jgi:hypothetical protein